MLPERHPVKSTDYAITIDVEDYFHVAAFETVISPDRWDQYPCHIEANVQRIIASLDATSEQATKATFFVLGWVAERYPALIREIAALGHEIASHGYHHQRLNRLSQREFRQDITRSKALLEDLVGAPVAGYRAPSFSFDENRPWIQDELREAGYRYSSSINPVPHDLYGYRKAPRTPFLWDNGLLEVPVATAEVFNRRIPCAGGGYFRLYPYALSKRLLQKAARQLAGPVVFYVHPWEIAPDQPRIQAASVKSRFRHYLNLHRTLPRLERLLSDFHWGKMCDLPVVVRYLE
ncbi:XrtA system polysaccharide deacetylase [Marinobacterium rhizophilum]|uniref:XrtA system polysaccharide deacetylase n=1 Tax=Marinobacterium rhizophilum TaxID=420402 RepID=UPI0003823556|nr:XrtA system polysaccharide deacetylase [Marinobacterium rhizophilum]